jgi:hypothetical protein
MTAGARRAIIGLAVTGVAVNAATVVLAARDVAGLRTAVLTQCKFDADLGGAPVAVSPATGKPSLLGVTIVSDARIAWYGLGCPGRLAPPAPSFGRWAAYYHLPDR